MSDGGAARERIRAAWQGRVSGCLLGKPVEVLSMQRGRAGLTAYLERAGTLPLRDYIPALAGSMAERLAPGSCRGRISRSESGGDFSTAIGKAVAAGWDTDCNGATVGGLMGLSLGSVPDNWTRPWAGRISVDLAGIGELRLEDLVDRTVAVSRTIDIDMQRSEPAMVGTL